MRDIDKNLLAKAKPENVYRLARYLKIRIDSESYNYAAMKWLYSQIENRLVSMSFDMKDRK